MSRRPVSWVCLNAWSTIRLLAFPRRGQGPAQLGPPPAWPYRVGIRRAAWRELLGDTWDLAEEWRWMPALGEAIRIYVEKHCALPSAVTPPR